MVQIWENNSDTPIDLSNLSKTIDVQSDSKFIYLTNSTVDMAKWADYIINSATWPAGDPKYLNKVVYNAYSAVGNPYSQIARKGTVSYSTNQAGQQIEVYDWTANNVVLSPYNRLLSIRAKTKISMTYTDIFKNKMMYISFDVGPEDLVFSYDDVLIDSAGLDIGTEYEIYAYHTKLTPNTCLIKILRKNQTDSSWKTVIDDPTSPTGKRVIAYRLLGGFKTDASRQIIEDSIWDLATMKTEIISQKYKIYKEGVGISTLGALDVPILDANKLFPNENNVEGALSDVKGLLENLRKDVYVDNRFGVRLLYSQYKKLSGQLAPCLPGELTLKITAGSIDVYGTRVKIPSDIFLATNTILVGVSQSPPQTGVTLGPDNSPTDFTLRNKVFVNPDGSSLVWRVFLTQSGQIYLKNPSDKGGMPTWSSNLGGWYDLDPNGAGRCIGKFQASLSGSYYIDKMSVTETYDQNMPTNTIISYHGLIAPDGLLPCDGKWHDINGIDPNSYDIMPTLDKWVDGRWYEETPNMLDRTLKMSANPYISNTGGPFFSGTNSGGSKDAGLFNSITSKYHSHTLEHDHGAGTIRISDSGQHATHTVEFSGTAFPEFQAVQSTAGSHAAAFNHTHNLLVSGGKHTHPSDSFVGRTELITGTAATSSQASSWAPYKEILFCIKK